MIIFPASLAAGDPLTDGGGDGELCQFIVYGVASFIYVKGVI